MSRREIVTVGVTPRGARPVLVTPPTLRPCRVVLMLAGQPALVTRYNLALAPFCARNYVCDNRSRYQYLSKPDDSV